MESASVKHPQDDQTQGWAHDSPRAMQSVRDVVQWGLKRFGYHLQNIKRDERGPYQTTVALPADALTVLRPDHPALADLRKRYAATGLPVVVPSLWDKAYLGEALQLAYFRGDNAYIWGCRTVTREEDRMRYMLYGRYIQSLDKRGLLGTLKEDGAFGCWHYLYETLPVVSRDLLDSINELYFLDRHFRLFDHPKVRVLDIGAGYGRMAYRTLTAAPNVTEYYCTDAVPESTYLCEYYLKHRGCTRAEVVPLDRFQARMQPGSIDLALNIHSFSECTYASIEWWMKELVRLKVPYFMLVPNDFDALLSYESDRKTRRPYAPLLAELGYERVAHETIYQDADVASCFPFNDHMMLFVNRSFA
jgi:hypothetical protein